MRLVLAVFLAILVAACSQAPVAPDVPATSPPEEEPFVQADGICGAVPYIALADARQNASLAGDFTRTAESTDSPEAAREAYCAAAVYLRWLLANNPTYTGSDPDDRHYRRMANAHEFFAGLPEADRRAHLDSALTLRQRADEIRRELSLLSDPWAADLREGVFFFSNADAYEDASRRQFDAFDRAFQAAPDQIDDWYLRQLVVLSAEWTETCEERADYLTALAEHADDVELRRYIAALADSCPPPPPDNTATERLVIAFEAGELTDCEPSADVRQLVGLAARYPELITKADGIPEQIIDTLLDCVAEPESAGQAYALFVRSWRRGDQERAEAYFQVALDLSENDLQRADFHYARAARDMGDIEVHLQRGVEIGHGPSLYLRATRLASRMGPTETIEQRAAYWCIADAFLEVAATGDPRVASRAREAARHYRDAGPSREDVFFRYQPGDPIEARSGGVSCTTRVR
ncbi:MAG: hypothetical protein AAGI52_01580 [Bacteroidota bacterium]